MLADCVLLLLGLNQNLKKSLLAAAARPRFRSVLVQTKQQQHTVSMHIIDSLINSELNGAVALKD